MQKNVFFPKLDVRDIAILGLLVALAIINGRILSFSYPPGQTSIKITISFVVALAAILYGPIYGAIFGGIVDVIGFSLFPLGTYYPGFTISAMVAGFIPGLAFALFKQYKVKFDLTYISIGVLIATIPFAIYYTIDRANNDGLEQRFVPILISLFIATSVIMAVLALYAKFKFNKDTTYRFDKVFAAVLPAKMIVSFVLNPIWLSHMFGSAYIAFLPLRFIVFPISASLSIIVLYIVLNRFEPLLYKKNKKVA